MQYNSYVEERGQVSAFPEFLAERVYMREFRKADGLPEDLSRWSDVVDTMLDGVDSDGPIYLMIDQAKLEAGQFHRRPGLHIDGYWNAGTGWEPLGPAHKSISTHSGKSTEQQIYEHLGIRIRGHRGMTHHPEPTPSGHSSHGAMTRGKSTWSDSSFSDKEAIILCSDVSACRALTGTFEGPIGEGGDCSNVLYGIMEETMMLPNRIYAGNVTMVHETLKVDRPCFRSVVRLNVPGWHPTIN